MMIPLTSSNKKIRKIIVRLLFADTHVVTNGLMMPLMAGNKKHLKELFQKPLCINVNMILLSQVMKISVLIRSRCQVVSFLFDLSCLMYILDVVF